MLNTQERMQFVVRFAGMDLDRLRPGDWLNLQDDFKHYVYDRPWGPGPVGALNLSLDRPGPVSSPESNLSEEEFRSLQPEIREILQHVVAVRRMVGPDGGHIIPGVLTPITITCSLSPHDWAADIIPTRRGRSTLLIMGMTRDVFLVSVFLLFAYEKTGKIGQCPACHALFLPVKKQAYCSKRCQMRVYMQQRRQQEHVKEQEAEQAHARYAKRVKERSGGKARRRPRKGGKIR